ncbi:MAG: hypothetical protein ACK50Y_07855 [Flavobacteriia bacterium]
MNHSFGLKINFLGSKGIFIPVFLVLFSSCQTLLAQPTAQSRKKNPYNWIITGGYVVVNDNEEKLPNLFDVQGSWNFAPYPSFLSVNKFSKKGISNEGVFTFTPYRSSVIVNDSVGVNGFLASANYNYKLSLNQFIKMSQDLDPFMAIGGGFTYRSIDEGSLSITANLTLGLNYWLSKNWGLQVQGIGKLALVPGIYRTIMDYVQYTAGLAYRTMPKKKNKRPKKRYEWTRERNNFKRKNT